MEFETYADVIDAYNANDMGYSSLTDYIKGQNIKIKEIEMEPLADLQRSLFENKADGGSVGIEVLFGPKVPAAPSQLVSESDILLGYRGDDAARSDRASGRSSGRADPSGGVDRSAVSEGSQYARNVAAQNNEPSLKEKIKSVVTNPAVQTIGGAVLTGGINTAFPGVLDKLNKARMISNAIKYGKDIAMEDELESITETGGIVPYANGGRVGFFMGGPALEGQALQIYNSMNAYGFSDQEIADALSARGLYTPAGSGTTQPEQVTGIINQQIQTGGGRDDNQTGFGKFGNLDPNTKKTFVKDVYTIDKNMYPGAPMTGSFKPTEVTGYLNVNTGNYQTLEGKNINHAGLNVKPGIIAMAEALGLGPIDETQFTGLPYAEGQIAGTFTGKKLSDFNPFKLFKKQQATVAEIKAMNQKAIAADLAKQRAEEAAKRAATERAIISGGPIISGGGDGGGGNITTRSGDTFAPGDYSAVAGTLADPREKMDYYRDGGLATMFTRRR